MWALKRACEAPSRGKHGWVRGCVCSLPTADTLITRRLPPRKLRVGLTVVSIFS